MGKWMAVDMAADVKVVKAVDVKAVGGLYLVAGKMQLGIPVGV